MTKIVTPDKCFNCHIVNTEHVLCARCSKIYYFDGGAMKPIANTYATIDETDTFRVAYVPEKPTKQRSGDQPLPTKNDYPAVQDLVKADIERRKQIGIARYGTLLQPFNGRDVLLDIYEELLDAAIYMRQLMYERDQK